MDDYWQRVVDTLDFIANNTGDFVSAARPGTVDCSHSLLRSSFVVYCTCSVLAVLPRVLYVFCDCTLRRPAVQVTSTTRTSYRSAATRCRTSRSARRSRSGVCSRVRCGSRPTCATACTTRRARCCSTRTYSRSTATRSDDRERASIRSGGARALIQFSSAIYEL